MHRTILIAAFAALLPLFANASCLLNVYNYNDKGCDGDKKLYGQMPIGAPGQCVTRQGLGMSYMSDCETYLSSYMDETCTSLIAKQDIGKCLPPFGTPSYYMIEIAGANTLQFRYEEFPDLLHASESTANHGTSITEGLWEIVQLIKEWMASFQ